MDNSLTIFKNNFQTNKYNDLVFKIIQLYMENICLIKPEFGQTVSICVKHLKTGKSSLINVIVIQLLADDYFV
ncbi:MAG TPA: hypothetical protein DIW31_06395 [Bacteroidales bacterium]|nr:hypothetical protein [Bacteroidales bacterium]